MRENFADSQLELGYAVAQKACQCRLCPFIDLIACYSDAFWVRHFSFSEEGKIAGRSQLFFVHAPFLCSRSPKETLVETKKSRKDRRQAVNEEVKLQSENMPYAEQVIVTQRSS